MRKYITKADIILFFVLIAAGLAATAVLAISGNSTGDKVVIESGGELYATYSLLEDRTIVVSATGSGENTVEIRDGEVAVTGGSCKNQVCVKHGAISHSGESIICLPNRLVVRIEGSGKGGGYDTVTS